MKNLPNPSYLKTATSQLLAFDAPRVSYSLSNRAHTARKLGKRYLRGAILSVRPWQPPGYRTAGNTRPTVPNNLHELLAVCWHADLDLLRLRLFTLGQTQGQDPVAIVGPNVLRANRIGKREAPHERAVCTFNPEIVFFFDVLFELPLAADGQCVAFHAD